MSYYSNIFGREISDDELDEIVADINADTVRREKLLKKLDRVSTDDLEQMLSHIPDFPDDGRL